MPVVPPAAPESTQATDAAKKEEGSGFDLQAILEIIDPSERVEVQDALGNTYKMPMVLPGRTQLRAGRRLERLLDEAMDEGLELASNFRGMLDALRAVLSNDTVAEGLAEVFAIAHPRIVERAYEAAAEAAEERGEDLGFEASDSVALDLFPIEDLLEGMRPLFARLLKKAIKTAAPLMQ